MKKEKTERPRYYEIESFRRSVNRKLWFVMLFLGTLTLFSLFTAFVAFARPVPVVVFDAKGRPVLFEDTVSPRQNMQDVRVEYFVQEFIRRWVGVDSVNIDDDLERALSMMTPSFRQVVMSNESEISRRAKYKHQNVRSLIGNWSVSIGKYDPAKIDSKINVLAKGKMKFVPRFGEVAAEKHGETTEVSQQFLTQIVLQRVPITRVSIHGLQVEYCHTKFFENKKQLDAYMLERAATK